MFRILTFLIALSLAGIASASSILGRMGLSWPNYNDPGGPAMVTEIQTSIAEVSDNVPSRVSENTAVANSTTVTIEHNFGLTLADMDVRFYTGVGNSKVSADADLLGYTIAAGGDPVNEIDVTTPSSGGPHTFSIVANIRLSGGTSTTEFSGVLDEDISAGQVVKLLSNGNIAKAVRNVFVNKPSEFVKDVSLTATTIASPQVAIPGTANFVYQAGAYTYSASRTDQGRFTALSVTNLGAATNTNGCVGYNPVDGKIITSSLTNVGGITVQSSNITSNGVMSLAGSTTVATTVTGLTTRTSCRMIWDSSDNRHIVVWQRTGFAGYHLFTVASSAGTPTAGVVVNLVETASEANTFAIAFSPTQASSVFSRRTSNADCTYARVTSVAGVVTLTHSVVDTGNKCLSLAEMAYDSVNDVMVLPYTNTTTGGDFILAIQPGATAPTFGTAVEIDATSTTRSLVGSAVFDLYSTTWKLLFVDKDHFIPRIRDFSISGTAITLAGSSATSMPMKAPAPDLGPLFPMYDVVNSKIVICSHYTAKERYNCNMSGTYRTIDQSAIVGVLKVTGTTGQTKTVYNLTAPIPGFIGQTPGNPVYILKTGVLGSVADVIDVQSYQIGAFASTTTAQLDRTKLPVVETFKTFSAAEPLIAGELVQQFSASSVGDVHGQLGNQVEPRFGNATLAKGGTAWNMPLAGNRPVRLLKNRFMVVGGSTIAEEMAFGPVPFSGNFSFANRIVIGAGACFSFDEVDNFLIINYQIAGVAYEMPASFNMTDGSITLLPPTTNTTAGVVDASATCSADYSDGLNYHYVAWPIAGTLAAVRQYTISSTGVITQGGATSFNDFSGNVQLTKGTNGQTFALAHAEAAGSSRIDSISGSTPSSSASAVFFAGTALFNGGMDSNSGTLNSGCLTYGKGVGTTAETVVCFQAGGGFVTLGTEFAFTVTPANVNVGVPISDGGRWQVAYTDASDGTMKVVGLTFTGINITGFTSTSHTAAAAFTGPGALMGGGSITGAIASVSIACSTVASGLNIRCTGVGNTAQTYNLDTAIGFVKTGANQGASVQVYPLNVPSKMNMQGLSGSGLTFPAYLAIDDNLSVRGTKPANTTLGDTAGIGQGTMGFASSSTDVVYTMPIQTVTADLICSTPGAAAAGHGTTFTVVRRYTVCSGTSGVVHSTDNALTGNVFDIMASGNYNIQITDLRTPGTSNLGLSKNSNQLSTNILTITQADRLASQGMQATFAMTTGTTLNLNAGDRIYAHDDGLPDCTAAYCRIRITKIK